LKSDLGFLLCGGVKELDKPAKVIGLPSVGFGQGRLHIDHKLAIAIRDELEKYDGWIGWNSKLFDIPFLNDRLMFCGEDPVEKRFHIDLMYFARMGQAAMTSSRLDWVAKAMGCPSAKTALDMNTWSEAATEAITKFAAGRKNYDYIVAHNRADLDVTEWVYGKLKNRVRNINKG
jgi:uncharacterized protein YprB with RNaseH-like and TPR domain